LDRNQQMLQRVTKAALTTTTGADAILNAEQSDQFINLVVNQSTMLQECDVRRVDGPSGEFTKMDLTTPITEKATEGEAAANVTTHYPSFTKVEYSTVKVRSAIDITSEFIEDNIAKTNGRTQIMTAFADRISTDLEMLAIEGDSSLGSSTAEQKLLRSCDGWHVLTDSSTGTHQFDAGVKRVNMKMLAEMFSRLPSRYKKNRRNFRWICSPRVLEDFLYTVSGRSTDAGDAVYRGEPTFAPLGVKFMEVPLIPEDLTLSGTGSTGSFIWLADPKNFIWVIQRKFQMERERVPSAKGFGRSNLPLQGGIQGYEHRRRG